MSKDYCTFDGIIDVIDGFSEDTSKTECPECGKKVKKVLTYKSGYYIMTDIPFTATEVRLKKHRIKQ